MEKLEISITKMPVNLQALYCKGKFSDSIIECMYHGQAICLNSCRYANVVDKYNKLVEAGIIKKRQEHLTIMAGMSMECAG